MVQDKMEMSSVIRTLNEVENLKLLIFDRYQYQIFNFIPKPFLIDTTVAWEKGQEHPPEDDEDSNEEIIFSDEHFWRKTDTLDERIFKFSEAINVIKKRNQGSEKNPIDMRLLEIMEQFEKEQETPD